MKDKSNLVRIAIIERAQRYESMSKDDLLENNLNSAAKLANIAHGLRMAAQIIEEWKPNSIQTNITKPNWRRTVRGE